MVGADDSCFADLTFDDFRRLATDPSLSVYEKIGFPDEYRAGHEPAIFADIVRKLPQLSGRRRVVLDIGPGCSELPSMLRELCARQEHHLLLVDSEEMLAHHPDGDPVRKIAGQFPDCSALVEGYAGRVDAILAYSVLHYVDHRSIDEFFDAATGLLADGGSLLVGDIPNWSKRRRFFRSPAGQEFHRRFTGSREPPPGVLEGPRPGEIDDALLLGLVSRARSAGLDAYLVPQARELPMANRREDLLVHRP